MALIFLLLCSFPLLDNTVSSRSSKKRRVRSGDGSSKDKGKPDRRERKEKRRKDRERLVVVLELNYCLVPSFVVAGLVSD